MPSTPTSSKWRYHNLPATDGYASSSQRQWFYYDKSHGSRRSTGPSSMLHPLCPHSHNRHQQRQIAMDTFRRFRHGEARPRYRRG
jgi:hypothetical protein